MGVIPQKVVNRMYAVYNEGNTMKTMFYLSLAAAMTWLLGFGFASAGAPVSPAALSACFAAVLFSLKD